MRLEFTPDLDFSFTLFQGQEQQVHIKYSFSTDVFVPVGSSYYPWYVMKNPFNNNDKNRVKLNYGSAPLWMYWRVFGQKPDCITVFMSMDNELNANMLIFNMQADKISFTEKNNIIYKCQDKPSNTGAAANSEDWQDMSHVTKSNLKV